MKPLPFRLSARAILAAVALFVLCVASEAATTTNLADFGYGLRDLHSSRRHLLVILARFGTNQLANPPSYYDSLIFNAGGTNDQNVVDYMFETSNRRFTFLKAGLVGPIPFSDSERVSQMSDLPFQSNIVHRVMANNYINFHTYDNNSADGTVTDSELVILIISNDYLGGQRDAGFVTATNSGSPINFSGTVAHVGDTQEVATSAHELMHMLGPGDVYGTCNCRAFNLTMVSGSTPGTNLVHLDGWHKMQMLWSEPRLMTLNGGGVVSLPAAQLLSNNAPVILYDTSRFDTNAPINEAFMLEYRSPELGGYDRNAGFYDVANGLRSTGLVVWQVAFGPDKGYVSTASAPGAQRGWAICQKCGLTTFATNAAAVAQGRCAADNTQHNGFPGYAVVPDDPGHPGQSGWRRCRKCQVLYFGPNEASSVCTNQVSGNTHLPPTDPLENHNYTVPTNLTVTAAISVDFYLSFLHCNRCQALYEPTVETNALPTYPTTCPAGGAHNGNGSITYYVYGSDPAMFSLGAPTLERGGLRLWGGGAVTDKLRWLDTSPTTTHLEVRPFTPGSSTISVEIVTEADTWVDFNFVGSPRNGSFSQPYNTLADGVSNAAWGGIVNFKPGSRNEPAIITKRLTLVAPLGTVTIGQ